MTISQERFWTKVDTRSQQECWNWKAATDGHYGMFWDAKAKKNMKAHRVSWVLKNGKIPDAMLILHKCDNTKCVNPDHLFIGTHKDNAVDMSKKGRSRNGGTIPPTMCGEDNARSKLSRSDVENIRNLRRRYPTKTVAKIFGISQGHVSKICTGVNWKSNFATTGAQVENYSATSGEKLSAELNRHKQE